MKKTALLLFLIVLGISTLRYLTVSPVKNVEKVSAKNSDQTQTTKATYCAWLPWWNENEGYNSFTKAVEALDQISPVWYKIDETSALQSIKVNTRDKILQLAQQSSIEVLPTITNEFDPERVSTLIRSQELSLKFINTLLENAREQNYQGYDIDFEYLHADDKDLFNQFIRTLAQSLRDNNLKTSVSTHAKIGDGKDWAASLAHDYASLSNSADQIRVMAYDYHNTTSKAGPIAPIDWIKKVIEYSKQHIEAKKLVIALPTYGYKWSSQATSTVDYQTQQISQFQTDEQSGELYTISTEGNSASVTWLQDKHSVLKKIDLAKTHGVSNFCFWKLGGEDQDLWSSLEQS